MHVVECLSPSWYIMEDDAGIFHLKNLDTDIGRFRTLNEAKRFIQRNGNAGDTVNVTYRVRFDE